MFGFVTYAPMVKKRKVRVRKKNRSMRVTLARRDARLRRKEGGKGLVRGLS